MATEIITREDLHSFKIELLEDLKSLLHSQPNQQKKWLKSADVRKMLSISSGTLQTLRINRVLPYTKVGGTLFYDLDDVTKVLNKNMQNRK